MDRGKTRLELPYQLNNLRGLLSNHRCCVLQVILKW